MPPSNPPELKLGITLGPERMTPRYLDRLQALGKPLILRVPVRSQQEAKDVLIAIQDRWSLRVLLLIEKPDLDLVEVVAVAAAHAFPGRVAGVELCNECDLQNISARDFGAFVLTGYQRFRRAGFDGLIVSGGIYTVSDETLSYLRDAAASWPADLVLGLHWYGDSSDSVLAAAQSLHRPLAVTEFGMPSRNAQEDAAQVVYLREKIQDFTTLGAVLALPYQLISGPCGDQSNLANFGLLRCDDSAKPGWDVLR